MIIKNADFDRTGFSERLKLQRVLAGFPRQQDLAEAVGMTVTAISNYETGKRVPSIDTVWALSVALNCTIDYLVGTDRRKTENEIDIYRRTGFTAEQLRVLQKLKDQTLFDIIMRTV